MKMFCTNCGKRIIDTARFCNYCGVKIVEFDENRDLVSDNITENPVSSASDNVINAENVENSVNLLKMTASVQSYIPKMNEQPKSGYSPDSMPISPDSGLSETGTAPAYLDPAADPYAAPAASSLPEAGTAPAYPDPAADPYADPAASSLSETGTAPAYLDPAADPYAAPAASGLPEAGTAPAYLDPATDPYVAPAASGLPKEDAPRKYTLGHLIMCLAASGIMAIAAGIFAGLYFSVV